MAHQSQRKKASERATDIMMIPLMMSLLYSLAHPTAAGNKFGHEVKCICKCTYCSWNALLLKKTKVKQVGIFVEFYKLF